MGGNGVDVREKSIRLTFTHEGTRHRRTLETEGTPLLPTAANVKYAQRIAREIKDKIRLGVFSLADYFSVEGESGLPITVAGQLDSWLQSQRIEDSTKAGYASAIKFWSDALPDKPLKLLKHSDILKVISARPDLSGKTINNYVSPLREAMTLAIRDNLILVNPVAEIPRAKHQKKQTDPFSRDEADRICAGMGELFPGQIHNFVEFWMWTGLRTSEIFGLRWDNVDLLGTILVAEAVVAGERKDKTKTNVARTVKLNSRALAAIKRQKEHTWAGAGAVFTDPRYGSPWKDERAFRRSYWTPTLKSLGIRYHRPYDMRHTYATQMLMAGMTPAFCAKQLGHSIEMFLGTYSKWMDGAQNDREMDRLEAALSPSCP